MFSSQRFLSGKGPLGAVWVAAYFFKKLKRPQVTQTDIASSVDKILQTEFDVVAYRVLACLLLGVVRIYSKKVEYLFADCNKVLLMVKDFTKTHRDSRLVEKMRTPYFSITRPETFELDAFDLEIVDDTYRENVISPEEITLKDDIWKSGAKQRCFGKDDFNDVADSWDSFLGCPSFGEAWAHLAMDLEESSYRDHEDLVLHKTLSDEEVTPVIFEISSQCYQTEGENSNIPQVVNPVQADDDACLCQEAPIILEKSTVVEGKPENAVESLHGNHVTDPEKSKRPTMAQTDIQMHQVSQEASNQDDLERMHQVIKGEYNQSDFPTTIEKTCDGLVQTMDTEMAEEPPQYGRRAFDGGHQNDIEHSESSDLILSARGNCQAVAGEHEASIKVDVNMKGKDLEASGATTPDFLATPAAKDRVRISRKRKCVCDDVIVFPNRILKQHIEDASDLVCKRKKFPHTSLATWKCLRIPNLSKSFLEPLIPYSSSELRSLFYMDKSKVRKSVETRNRAKFYMPDSTGACRSSAVGHEEPVGLSDAAVSSGAVVSSHKKEIPVSIDTVEPREMLLSSGSSAVGQPVEEPAGISDVGESSRVLLPVELIEPSVKGEISGSVVAEGPRGYLSPLASSPVGQSVDEHVAMSNGPVSSHAAMSVETVEPSDKPDTTGAPVGEGGLLEEPLIAPVTPTRQMTSLRSIESPEMPGMLNSIRPKFLNMEQERSLRGGDTDLECMNEEIKPQEVDNQTGWSDRTRAVMRRMSTSFSDQGRRKEEGVLSLLRLLDGKTRKESSRMFYEILVLSTKGCVRVKQEEPYGDIRVQKSARWDQAIDMDGPWSC